MLKQNSADDYEFRDEYDLAKMTIVARGRYAPERRMGKIETRTAAVQNVAVTDDSLMVDLIDGRTVSVPLAWYPRLLHGLPGERNNWHLIGQGEGIHWPDLDEDISAENILFGQPSGESQRSLSRWLQERATTQPTSSRLQPA